MQIWSVLNRTITQNEVKMGRNKVPHIRLSSHYITGTIGYIIMMVHGVHKMKIMTVQAQICRKMAVVWTSAWVSFFKSIVSTPFRLIRKCYLSKVSWLRGKILQVVSLWLLVHHQETIGNVSRHICAQRESDSLMQHTTSECCGDKGAQSSTHICPDQWQKVQHLRIGNYALFKSCIKKALESWKLCFVLEPHEKSTWELETMFCSRATLKKKALGIWKPCFVQEPWKKKIKKCWGSQLHFSVFGETYQPCQSWNWSGKSTLSATSWQKSSAQLMHPFPSESGWLQIFA